MPISRSEGYRRSQGKEEGGLVVAEAFFESVVRLRLQRITDPEENYFRGDFTAPSGLTIECKRQPIDPIRFKNNFVEVCEETASERHSSGFADLAELLGMSEERLAAVRVKVRGRQVLLGRPAHLSISVRSMFGSALTIYVNPGPPVHLYVYQSLSLVEAIKTAMSSQGMVRGAGASNRDTFAVFLPVPSSRWTASVGEPWRYNGDGQERVALDAIRQGLK